MFTVNVINATGFSAENFDKVTKAKEAIGKVFNSDIFKDAVLNFQFDGEETFYYE